jgi:sporulation protein YlmC with PRC-barrel domain
MKGVTMLRKVSDLFDYSIQATDGEIGNVHDLYFDGDEWTVRYITVDLGFWIFGRRVLIAPESLHAPSWDDKVLPVSLTKQQVEESPDIDLSQSVTREHETRLRGYYGWPAYWGMPGMYGGAGFGVAPVPVPVEPASTVPDEVTEAMRDSERSHIHSARDVTGYSIEATDGSIGHVEDFFIDDTNWKVVYLLIDTASWMPGKQVIVSPLWVERVDWADSKVYVKVTKAQVENSPEYDPHAPIARDYEGRLHRHYGYEERW